MNARAAVKQPLGLFFWLSPDLLPSPILWHSFPVPDISDSLVLGPLTGGQSRKTVRSWQRHSYFLRRQRRSFYEQICKSSDNRSCGPFHVGMCRQRKFQQTGEYNRKF